MTISLIAAGLRAPSGDNTQPWHFEHRADGFALRFVPERSRSLMDCTTFASRIAAGALLENARLEALANGHVLLTYRVDPDPGDPTLWAEASVAPSTSSQTDDLHIAIPTRESNRCLFNGRPLAPGLAMALDREVSPPIRLHLLCEGRQKAAVAELAGRAERLRAEDSRCHEDFHRWLRWTPAQVQATRDGVDVRNLVLKPIERVVVATFRPWHQMRMAIRFQKGGRIYFP